MAMPTWEEKILIKMSWTIFGSLIKKKYNKDISNDIRALGNLQKENEIAKRALSNQHQVYVEIESLFDGVDFFEPL